MEQNELDYILANFHTQELPSQVYIYRDTQQVKFSYYMPDIKRLTTEGVFIPIYYFKDDIIRLSLSDTLLYQKVMENMRIILPGQIIPFSLYLEEKRKSTCQDTLEYILMKHIGKCLTLLTAKEQLWCMTNIPRYNGSVSVYDKTALKNFCDVQKYSEVLIGVGNQDYAYLMYNSTMNQTLMSSLITKCPNIMEDGRILKCPYLFIYNNKSNQLSRIPLNYF